MLPGLGQFYIIVVNSKNYVTLPVLGIGIFHIGKTYPKFDLRLEKVALTVTAFATPRHLPPAAPERVHFEPRSFASPPDESNKLAQSRYAVPRLPPPKRDFVQTFRKAELPCHPVFPGSRFCCLYGSYRFPDNLRPLLIVVSPEGEGIIKQ